MDGIYIPDYDFGEGVTDTLFVKGNNIKYYRSDGLNAGYKYGKLYEGKFIVLSDTCCYDYLEQSYGIQRDTIYLVKARKKIKLKHSYGKKMNWIEL